MDALLGVLGVFAFLGLCCLGLWIADRIRYPKLMPEQRAEHARRFRERLHNPNFELLEAHYACEFPAALKALYANAEELNRGDFEVAESPDASEDKRWYIAFYEPADAEALAHQWLGTEQYFEFANDGCGNGYMIDPSLPDPEVLFHDHETGEFTPVCDSLANFLSWPRIEIPARDGKA